MLYYNILPKKRTNQTKTKRRIIVKEWMLIYQIKMI